MREFFGPEWLLVVIALGCCGLVLVMEWVRDWWGSNASDWETECLKRPDRLHCNCWYDGEACCACGDPTCDTISAAAFFVDGRS